DVAEGRAWSYKLPHPMLVVASINRTDLLTNLDETDMYTYHDGYYDGDEKQFRGYEEVELRGPSDPTQEERQVMMRYEVGAADPYRKDLLVYQSTSSAGRPLVEEEMTYDDCPVAEIPNGTELPVRYICQTATRTILKEGLGEERWIVAETQSVYDGYGNIIESRDQGVVSEGGGACSPCGDRDQDTFGAACGSSCLGDESFTLTDFIEPGEDTSERWILNALWRTRAYGREGSNLVSEVLTYYDGEAFMGMTQGTLDKGDVTRVTTQKEVGSNTVIETVRNAYDAHGNVIDTLDPLGEIDGHSHRRQYTMSDDGLRVVRAEVLLEDSEGNPYTLRRTVNYETIFDKTAESTAWLRVVDNEVASTRRATTFTYDEFGRMSERYELGNVSDAPDTLYTYDLQSPASRIAARVRSEQGGAYDLETVYCLDGRGRVFQQRTRLGDGSWQVTGLTLYNRRSVPVEVFQPYLSDTGQCDAGVPDNVRSTTTRYDGLGRMLERNLPDGDLYDGASTVRTVYEPLTTLYYDQEDTDPTSPHMETPVVQRRNGLGQTVAIERWLSEGDRAMLSAQYDGLGRLIHVIDPNGNVMEQHYDLLGRVTRVIDPNSANETTMEYDDASNLIRKTDDRGITTVTEYDGMNRPTAIYDEADRDGTLIANIYDVAPSCAACSNTEGKLAIATYPGPDGQLGVERFGYDLRDRAIYASRHLNGFTFEFTTAWDNVSRATEVTYPGGRTISRTFDDASRLIAVDGIISEITYSARNQPAQMLHDDGTETRWSYDSIMRLSEQTTDVAGTTLQGFTLQRDRVGNVLTITDLTEEAPSFASSFSYDAWYRVMEANLGQGNDFKETVSYDFNLLDNITARTSTRADSAADLGEFEYNSYAPNALTDVSGLMFGYDEAGNMNGRGAWTMEWDFMGRMTSVSGDSSTVARFTYGRNQSRVAKSDADGDVLYASHNFEARDGVSTLYIKVGRHRVARIESTELATEILGDPMADGEVNAADAFASREDDPATFLRSATRRLLVETGPDAGITWLHQDHLGSITLATGLIDGEPERLGHRTFHLLGQERSDSWGYVDAYGFTGQELDRSTGLIHFDWRYLDPATGRWLSIDPAFGDISTADDILAHLGEATTSYAYVAGNFVNAFDPTGLWLNKAQRAIKAAYKQNLKDRGLTKRQAQAERGDVGMKLIEARDV
ncbi:MAG: RHS repeat-associated core domain-containing protein, partial [Myxococcota bacterium]